MGILSKLGPLAILGIGILFLGNALTRNRFNKPESIFNQIDLGIVGRREKTLQRSNVVYDGGINGAKIVVTNRDSSGTGALEGYNLIPYKKSFFFGSKQDAPINTEAFDINQSSDFGMHFTATQRHVDYIQQHNPANIGQRYHTFKGYLQISNPYRMNDLMAWDPDLVIDELVRDDMITREQGNKLLKNNPTEFIEKDDMEIEDNSNFYKAIITLLKDKGHDGIVYSNLYEHGQEYDIGDKLEDTWIAFDNTQFKEVSNVGGYNAGDPNMFASRQWQESEGGMPDDQYVPLNRQQERDLNRRAFAAKQGIDKSVEEKADFGGKALSWINRWFGAMREWASTNLQNCTV